MSLEISQEGQNPIGDKYSAIASLFLEAHLGREVNAEMIDYLGTLLSGTVCELVGLRESAEILDVSRQRAYQLKDRMSPTAGKIAASPIWLREQVTEFKKTRNR